MTKTILKPSAFAIVATIRIARKSASEPRRWTYGFENAPRVVYAAPARG